MSFVLNNLILFFLWALQVSWALLCMLFWAYPKEPAALRAVFHSEQTSTLASPTGRIAVLESQHLEVNPNIGNAAPPSCFVAVINLITFVRLVNCFAIFRVILLKRHIC